MTDNDSTAAPENRWFLTASAETWHVLADGERALCRKNITPRAAMRAGVSQKFRDTYALPIPKCLNCMRKLATAAPSVTSEVCSDANGPGSDVPADVPTDVSSDVPADVSEAPVSATAVVRLTDRITFNPETGNHHVRDADGHFVGDTTQRDVAYRWAGQDAPLGDNPATPVSVMVGAVRVALADGWEAAQAALWTMITDAYMPNGPMTFPLRDGLQYRFDHEMAQVAAGPVESMIVTAGSWASGDSARCAWAGIHGLAAGDLVILRDVPNGSLHRWTISVKARITLVTGLRVTVRVAGDSVQFRRGEIVTVDASRVRPRTHGGR